MILINLLPHREAARKRRREAFQAALFASFLMGLVVAGGIYWWLQMLIIEQQEKNSFLKQEIAVLENQIKEIANIEDEIAALVARQKAVENLQSDRNTPVHLLNELVKQLPDGVYVSNFKQVDRSVTLQGMAQSNERVSELLRNLSDNTPWISKPELQEIISATVPLTPKDQRRVSSFRVKFTLTRPAETKSPSNPAKGASGEAK